MKKLIIILHFSVFLIVPSTKVSSQSENARLNGRISVLLNFYGPQMLGAYLNYHMNNYLSINSGIGINLDPHIGINLYLSLKSSPIISFYAGSELVNYREFYWGSVNSGDSRETQLGLYVPIGIEMIEPKGFTLQFDIGPNLFVTNEWNQRNTRKFIGSLKIGKTFNKKRHN